jgi:hypothetical protein
MALLKNSGSSRGLLEGFVARTFPLTGPLVAFEIRMVNRAP